VRHSRKINNRFPAQDAVMNRADKILAASGASAIDVVEYKKLAESYGKLYYKLHKTLVISDSYEQQNRRLTTELEKSLNDFRALQEVVLPVCMVCHKIHTADGNWIRLETFFGEHAGLKFSHGICDDCVKQTYGKLGEQILAGRKPGSPHISKKPKTDESVKEMNCVVEKAVGSNNPLASDIEKIVNRYAKLLRRFYKIVSLSDSYQLYLREFNLRLQLMAKTDPLTGISNRSYFMDLLNTEFRRSMRHKRTFSVLSLDLDNFKSINDTYGHAAGDEVLRSATRILQNSELRKGDFFGRIGGEEFGFVLPETDLKGASDVAERLRINLEKTAVVFKRKELYVTASIGASEYKAGDTEDTLLQRADQAMYRAKKSGRNKVCLS
jgi:diguanylate cyclase (GGDEF)-like protein